MLRPIVCFDLGFPSLQLTKSAFATDTCVKRLDSFGYLQEHEYYLNEEEVVRSLQDETEFQSAAALNLPLLRAEIGPERTSINLVQSKFVLKDHIWSLQVLLQNHWGGKKKGGDSQ